MIRRPSLFSETRGGRSARRGALLAAGAALLAPLAPAAPPSAGSETAPAAIEQQLRGFENFGSVLYIAAHPDDEDTQLIAYLARGRDCRTAYLSLTRGDGGQNLLGPEFGDTLGVIRTQELLAARRIDGGRQFFSRARDFGYSKDYRQTLKKWDRQEVLSDIVRVIRVFRPDVLITRFPPEPGGTHGHHTASTVLALEAFRLAGDPRAFPEQLDELKPWQPKRILWDEYNFGPARPHPGSLRLRIDGRDPVTGQSLLLLAARSRSMHRTQGFGNFPLAAADTEPRFAFFRLLAGSPARHDIFDGIDTTWGRVPGGAEIGRLAAEALARFDPKDPSASVSLLLEIREKAAALPADPVVEEKRRQLDRILGECLGLSFRTTVSTPEVVPGESVRLRSTAAVHASVPVRWLAVRYPGIVRRNPRAGTMAPGETSALEAVWTLPPDTPPSQPYWLREDETPGMFQVDDPSLIGRPENPPLIPVEDVFAVGSQTLVLPDQAVFVSSQPGRGEVRRRPDAIAPVALSFGSPVALFAPGSTREVAVDVAAYRPGVEGTLRLRAPAAWRVAPSGQPFRLAAVGDRARFVFEVTAPPAPAVGEIAAEAETGGRRFDEGRVEIDYPHIPFLLLQPRARLKAVDLELAIRGRRVGYLPGAGDGTAAALEQMGYAVVSLTGADLEPERLGRLDAVVIGVRAFNTRRDLPPRLPALFAYVEAGGTVVEQYNTPNGLLTDRLAPYAMELSRDLPRYRVTDESGPVALLQPDHPAFNEPNRIGPADFSGWVQERGLDFASDWDRRHFTPLIACSDPGEAPLEGGLLVARCGRGYFVYTGLSFFRQLPAGVPGAYRLFANLVSLGK